MADPTPDAVEYQLLARSLARGEGLVLPVRVRHDAIGVETSVRHEARAERAPLLPVLLAGLEKVGVDGDGPRVSVGLQGANAVVGVVGAMLVAALAWELGRGRGRARGGLALVSGLVAAWLPPLVHESCRVLAEPLGLVFVLLAAHAEVRLARAGARRHAFGLALFGGLALVLARLARPEAEAVLALVLLARVVMVARGRVALAALLGTLVAVGVDLAFVGVGWSHPQSFLLRVGHFNDVMFDAGVVPAVAPSAVGYVTEHAAEVARKIVGNLADLGWHSLRLAVLVPVLGLVALVRGSPGERRLVLLALAFVAVAGAAWATRDHERFLVIPLALLAAPAVFQIPAGPTAGSVGAGLESKTAGEWLVSEGVIDGTPGAAQTLPVGGAIKCTPGAAQRLGGSRAVPFRLALAGAIVVTAPLLARVAPLSMRALERARAPEGDSVWGGPELDRIAERLRSLPAGEAFAAVSPWGLALASGRDGVLLPVHLGRGEVAGFLRDYPAVRVVVLRPLAAHDKLTPEPMGYLEELASIGSFESLDRTIGAGRGGDATLVRLSGGSRSR